MTPIKGFVYGNLIAGAIILVMAVVDRSMLLGAFGLVITMLAGACVLVLPYTKPPT